MDPADEEGIDELRKALGYFFEDVSIRRGTDNSVEVHVPDELSGDELRRIATHFLRGRRQVRTHTLAQRDGRRPHRGEARPDGKGNGVPDRVDTCNGVFLQGPEWAVRMEVTLAHVRQSLQRHFPGPRLVGPALIAKQTLVRAGYYKKFPQLVQSVSHMRANYWDGVTVGSLDHSQADALDSFYVPSDYVLNPVVCYHVYANAADLLSRYGDLRYSITGPVFRNEAHNAGPSRLFEFTMHEVVRLGAPEDVSNEFGTFLDALIELIDELGVPFRTVSASDAFFGAEPGLSRTAQGMAATKYEVRVPVGQGEISVASANLHGSVFAQAFDLNACGPIEASCCLGVGIDRLALAMHHHGLPAPSG